jgi:hypothetical protein
MKDFRSNIALIGRVFLHRYVLFVLNGFFLAATFFFYLHDSFESGLINAMANNVKEDYAKYKSEDSLLIGSLRLTYFLTERRNRIFEKEDLGDVYTDILRPVTYDLMTAKGACGSYSIVLGSILQKLGFQIRFAQMKVGEVWGGHILIEAKTSKGWAILDPSFNLAFKKPGGNLASFNDVKNNWTFYQKQLPNDYVNEYAYEDVRYTNWGKIPLLMPALKSVTKLFIGSQATEDLSIRTLFIRKFKILAYIALILYLFSWVKIIQRYRRKNIVSKKTISSKIDPVKTEVYKRA